MKNEQLKEEKARCLICDRIFIKKRPEQACCSYECKKYYDQYRNKVINILKETREQYRHEHWI